MKTWKILGAGRKTIAYVNFNEKELRDTGYCASQVVREHFKDNDICCIQLTEDDKKQPGIPVLEPYY